MNEPGSQDQPGTLEPAPWLDHWAQYIVESGWASLAVVALDTFRPLGPMASQCTLLVEPLLGPRLRSWMTRLRWLMEDPARIERLLVSIEMRGTRR